jgi:hypothetical protein
LVGIGASSVGGIADITDARLGFMVEAFEGETITQISFREGGIYSLDPTSSVAFQAGGFITFEDNGGVVAIPFTLTGGFTPSGGGSIGGGGLLAGTWEAAATIDLSEFEVSKINVAFDDIVIAASTPTGFALIDKKFANIEVEVIPEPAAGLALGTLSLLALRRRRVAQVA